MADKFARNDKAVFNQNHAEAKQHDTCMILKVHKGIWSETLDVKMANGDKLRGVPAKVLNKV